MELEWNLARVSGHATPPIGRQPQRPGLSPAGRPGQATAETLSQPRQAARQSGDGTVPARRVAAKIFFAIGRRHGAKHRRLPHGKKRLFSEFYRAPSPCVCGVATQALLAAALMPFSFQPPPRQHAACLRAAGSARTVAQHATAQAGMQAGCACTSLHV